MSRRDPWNHVRDPAAIRGLQAWGSHAVPDIAHGLAMSRADPEDFGPEVLAWRFGLSDDAAEHIVPRLSVLVLMESRRARIPVTDDQAAEIVERALRCFRGENCGPMALAARRAGMRRASFEHLLGRVQGALWGMLPGSLERFLAVFAQDAA